MIAAKNNMQEKPAKEVNKPKNAKKPPAEKPKQKAAPCERADLGAKDKAIEPLVQVKSKNSSKTGLIPHSICVDDNKNQKKFATQLSKLQVPKRIWVKPKMPLFEHLVQLERNISMADSICLGDSPIHPSFISFGLQCAENLLTTCLIRSVRLICCLKEFIKDYISPIPDDFSRDFESRLRPSLSFLSECRPNSSGMGTIIKIFKEKFSETHAMTEIEMKKYLIRFLSEFLNERIFLACDIISDTVNKNIYDDDVILTCSFSDMVVDGFTRAHNDKKKFKVIIVDFHPRREGIIYVFTGFETLKLLTRAGVKCVYIGVNGISMILPTVTKIIFPANSLLMNGAVLAPIGSAIVAILGKYSNIPVLVCCETYNFVERAQTDAFVFNELGDPDDIIDHNGPNVENIINWKDNSRITLVNPYYDVIQAEYVNAVLTEMGAIPSSSAPVILRVKN